MGEIRDRLNEVTGSDVVLAKSYLVRLSRMEATDVLTG